MTQTCATCRWAIANKIVQSILGEMQLICDVRLPPMLLMPADMENTYVKADYTCAMHAEKQEVARG